MTTQRENAEQEESFKDGNVSEACLHDVLEQVLDAVYVTDSIPTRTDPDPVREFRASARNVLHAVRAQSREAKPVTVAIDIVDFDAGRSAGPGSSAKHSFGWTDPNQRKAKLGVISVVSTPAPVVLGFDVIDPGGTGSQSKLPNIGDVTRSLLEQANDFVEIDTVLADQAFHSDQVLAELDQRDLRYIIPARPIETVKLAIAEARQHGTPEFATAEYQCLVSGKEFSTYIVLVEDTPSEKNYLALFTDEEPSPEDLENLANRYKKRWQIEEQTATLRSRLTTKSLPAGLQWEDYCAAAVDVNAHSLTHHLLGERLEPGEHYFLSFDRFLQSLHAQRAERFASNSSSDEHQERR